MLSFPQWRVSKVRVSFRELRSILNTWLYLSLSLMQLWSDIPFVRSERVLVPGLKVSVELEQVLWVYDGGAAFTLDKSWCIHGKTAYRTWNGLHTFRIIDVQALCKYTIKHFYGYLTTKMEVAVDQDFLQYRYEIWKQLLWRIITHLRFQRRVFAFYSLPLATIVSSDLLIAASPLWLCIHVFFLRESSLPNSNCFLLQQGRVLCPNAVPFGVGRGGPAIGILTACVLWTLTLTTEINS